MPWPSDPLRRELARQRHREAQQRRWQRPEERERARAAAAVQWADPEARRRMSEIKSVQYASAEGWDIRAKLSEARARQDMSTHMIARRQRVQQNREAQLAMARTAAEARVRRLALIVERAKGRVQCES